MKINTADKNIKTKPVEFSWNRGSVIRSWLVELMERGLRENKLDELCSYVEDTCEIKWAVEYAPEKEAWIPVIAQSELAFYRYRDGAGVQYGLRWFS